MSSEPLANGRREIYTLNVGQADAHAIITEDGMLTLIDADKDAVADELDTILAEREVPQTDTGTISIETFVLTHLDDDHTGGVGELYDRGYEIQHVIEPNAHRYELRDLDTEKPDKGVSPFVWETYERELQKHDPESVRQVSIGDPLTPDRDSRVLAPPDEPGTVQFTSPATGRKNTLKPTGANANSIAVKTEGQRSVLFMGDVEDTGGLNGESWLMDQHDSEENDVSLAADILVLAHHGSNNATSEEFLERVNPDTAVISSGLNNKNTSENEHDAHPHDATLKRLHDRDIEIYWTAGHGTLRTELDGDGSPLPEPTTDLETTNAADLAALKYYCREHEINPDTVGALPPGNYPKETPEWAIDAAPMIAETNEKFINAAIENAESIEDLRQTLAPTPEAHDQIRETVQADRDEHVTTEADVKRRREQYFEIMDAERAYKRLPLRTRLRANIPTKYGGVEHPLKGIPSSDEIDGPPKLKEVPRAVKKRPAAEERAKEGFTIDRQLLAAEEAADKAVDTADTRETLCRGLRDTPGTHQDFLYAIDTPNAHEKNKPEKDLDDLLEPTKERTSERERTKEQTTDQDFSLGM